MYLPFSYILSWVGCAGGCAGLRGWLRPDVGGVEVSPEAPHNPRIRPGSVPTKEGWRSGLIRGLEGMEFCFFRLVVLESALEEVGKNKAHPVAFGYS